jgi:hypothetical protein
VPGSPDPIGDAVTETVPWISFNFSSLLGPLNAQIDARQGRMWTSTSPLVATCAGIHFAVASFSRVQDV